MKKIFKCFLAMILALGCLTLMPAEKVEASSNKISINRDSWTGDAYDADGNHRQSTGIIQNNNNDTTMKLGMFDNSLTTLYHTGESTSYQEAKLPLYLLINLGETETFSGFSLSNRSANAIIEYDLYYNPDLETTLTIDGNTVQGDKGATWLSDKWERIIGSEESGQLSNAANNNSSKENYVYFGKSVTSNQVLLVVTKTNSVSNSGTSHVTCKNFELLRDDIYLDSKLNKANWTGVAFDSTTREEESDTNDGPVAFMLDSSNNYTRFHSRYNSSTDYPSANDKNDVPLYIFIDLNSGLKNGTSGQAKTFGAISWKSRNLNDCVKHLEVYVNESTTENKMPADDKKDGYTSVPEGWRKVGATTPSTPFKRMQEYFSNRIEGGKTDHYNYNNDAITNYLYLDEVVTATQVLIVVKETYEGTSQSYVSCEDFNLWTTTNVKPSKLQPDGWVCQTYKTATWNTSAEMIKSYTVANHLIDNNLDTIWHSLWDNDNKSSNFSIVINFNGLETFNRIRWINNGSTANGVLNGASIYIMNKSNASDNDYQNLANWTLIYQKGTIANADYDDCIFDLQTATHVRIDIKGREDFGSCKELEFYNDNRTDTNLALYATVSCGTNAEANTPLSGVNDGNPGSYCGISGNTNDMSKNYFQLDLGCIAEISSTKLISYHNDGRSYRNRVVVVSTDEVFDENDVILYNADSGNIFGFGNGTDDTLPETADGQTYQLANDEVVYGRYLRVYENGCAKADGTFMNNSNHIYEWEVYGKMDSHDSRADLEVNRTYEDQFFKEVLKESYYDESLTPITTDQGATILRVYEKNLLDIKLQSRNAKSNNTGRIDVRFIATVPSLNLAQVGFEVTINNQTQVVMSNKVFKTVGYIDGDTRVEIISNPQIAYDNVSSQYFFSYNLTDIPVEGDNIPDLSTPVTVRAFWISNGGEMPVLNSDKQFLNETTKDVQYGKARTVTLQELKDAPRGN